MKINAALQIQGGDQKRVTARNQNLSALGCRRVNRTLDRRRVGRVAVADCAEIKDVERFCREGKIQREERGAQK